MKTLKEKIQKIKAQVIKDRRYFHQNPELSNEEFQTAAYIMQHLKQMGIEYEQQNTSTSVIARIKGKQNGKKIAFRADMDALPINEETGLSFQSKKKNCMHACGHDAHSAILLGSARILKEYENELKGEVLFIFQAAEEASPQGGAKRILESGVLKDVDRIYGLHVWAEAQLGEFWLKDGAFMGGSDYFCVQIQGKNAHAAQPQKGIDALLAASSWLVNIHNIFAKRFSPFDNVALNIGKMNAGTKHNIIADKAYIEGTCRSLSQNNRELLKSLILNSLKALEQSFGVKSLCKYEQGYDVLINDKEALSFVLKSFEKYHIPSRLITEPSLCAEDFAFYLQSIQGAFLWLGVESAYPLHHNKFDINENVLEIGVLAFCALALEFLA